MQTHHMLALCSIVAVAVGCGNPRDQIPAHMYSGEFEVINESSGAIKVIDYSDFGTAMPGRGFIAP